MAGNMRFTRFLFLVLVCFSGSSRAQIITGVWHGKINRQKVEVKIVQKGDSLTGTSYYYESGNNYRRYSIKGYFDQQTNAVIWWDDRLIEEKSGRLSLSIPGKVPMLTAADFNCPGGGRMMLDGKAGAKEDDGTKKGDVHLDKSGNTEFDDEWDFVIDNYTVGGNDPEIIDSVSAIAFGGTFTMEPPAKPGTVETKPGVGIMAPPAPAKKPETISSPPTAIEKKPEIINPPLPVEEKTTEPVSTPPAVIEKKPAPAPPVIETKPEPVSTPPVVAEKKPAPVVGPPISFDRKTVPAAVPVATPPPAPTIQEKFVKREKRFIKEIPVTGDSIELRFYDNAEVDGDSISLFLDGKLIFEHIRLTAMPYTIKIATADINDGSELVMVAENLGSIPPNTSYMAAYVNEEKHEAFLSSTEGSSALIRLRKSPK